MESKIHDFKERLQWSESKKDESFWDAVYREFFPGLVSHMPATGDFLTQRLGIDRIIYLNNDRVLRIEEKKREKAYSDIALEFVHTKTPHWQSVKSADGWMERNLAIDYIAYAFIETQTVHFLDWLILRRAWVANKHDWKQRYFIASAKNQNYHSHSVCVPIEILQKAMNTSAIVTLTK